MRMLSLLICLGMAAAAADEPQVRSAQVPLPGQDQNAIKTSWPGIGCWFWKAEEFAPDGYKRFVDLHEQHSAYALLTTSIRYPVEVTDPAVHDQIKAATQYARERGMGVVMDLDVRLARRAFMEKYPDEMQEIVRLRQVDLAGSGWTSVNIDSINLGDHYTFSAPGYETISSRLLRVYAYSTGKAGILPDTVVDITASCVVAQADRKAVKIAIPDAAGGTHACVMAAFTLFAADVFAPHLVEFEREVLRQYADVPLAGACKDEWGFPGRFKPSRDDLYYSKAMADVYAKRTGGRDLARDLLLMNQSEYSHEQSLAAINHYMEMNWQRNGEVETAFYNSIKEVFGPQAMSATHPTWYPYPDENEAFKNGLDWWTCKRDLAQTDEVTPFCARTALAKKCHSPVWYNMYYNTNIEAYEKDLWSHALGGGRMNFHPLYPHEGDMATSLLHAPLLEAEARVRLLNYISTAPVDCPVAVIFGHPSALNWADPAFADVGLQITDALWAAGQYADLIPSSEIETGALTISEDGYVQYGPQKYRAAVLYHPQYSRRAIGDYWRNAAGGKTVLFHVGQWTSDFEGKEISAADYLTKSAQAQDAQQAAQEILAYLKENNLEPQTTCVANSAHGFAQSAMPEPAGRCRLLDGTRIIARGKDNVLGDPIAESIEVDGHEAAFDAIGIAAARFNAAGDLQAMAAGGLKSFKAGSLSIILDQPADIALWRAPDGQWQGILQGYDGPTPQSLTAITPNWTRLRLPTPLK